MHDAQGLTAQMKALFYPESVAIVGLPRGMKSGKLFLISMMEMAFPGPIYPVHPTADEIDGLKAYPSVSAIPGQVDQAIVLVPHESALPVVKECAAKGVKGVVLYTAGYKETGTAEGLALEEEMVRVARSAGMRLIGPNCMGFYVPKSGLSFFPGLSKESGSVGLVSHSGSLANIICLIAPRKGLRFSKAVSLGNECDLNSADFLNYLGEDPETKVIGAYIENIKDGNYFLKALKKACLKKPVVMWKVGLTPEGSRAASSHTGALTGSRETWEAVVRQAGAVPVVGLDTWVDTLMGFTMLPPDLGDRIAVLSAPGGLAVATAEAVGREGLRLAEISSQTRSKLAEVVPPTGTSLNNPIDLGFTASLNIDIYTHAALAVAADPGVDAIAVVGTGINPETNRIYTQAMIRTRQELQKPFIVIGIPGFSPDLSQTFCQAGVPFFETAERALATYARIRRYQVWRKERAGTI